jgi:hypothetical protein
MGARVLINETGYKVRDLFVLGDIYGLIERLKG